MRERALGVRVSAVQSTHHPMPARSRPANPSPGAIADATPTLANQLAAELSKQVLEGGVLPGANLREVPLAEAFGVSRGSVREALRILERDGVVRIEPHRGASVTRLSTDELIEIYQVRTVLLGLSMALCCARCTDDDVAWLTARLNEMTAADRQRDERAGPLHASISADMALYIVGHAGNARLERLLTQMSTQIARYTRLGLSSPARRAESLATWGDVVDAMRRRDAVDAERAGRKLVTDTFRFALGRIAGLDQQGGG
ncbi:MAG: GntR family transcriptional regulator [Burkholderiaceae bacterium]